MLQTNEKETEILLGNKQLLGIFFVAAVFLGVAFTGGYMLGRNSAEKKGNSAAALPAGDAPAVNGAGSPAGGETHRVPPTPDGDDAEAIPPVHVDGNGVDAQGPDRGQVSGAAGSGRSASDAEEPPLGSPKRKAALSEHKAEREEATTPAPVSSSSSVETSASYLPQPGQTFLQVAAVGRDEAEAVADVLHKKGFRAHAVAKPGSTKIYRVLIGPVHDAGDLSSTRDSLRRTGFREVIVQKY